MKTCQASGKLPHFIYIETREFWIRKSKSIFIFITRAWICNPWLRVAKPAEALSMQLKVIGVSLIALPSISVNQRKASSYPSLLTKPEIIAVQETSPNGLSVESQMKRGNENFYTLWVDRKL
ncbi:hypothetical protein F8388_020563 [Cannabis sativa]|uniref:Uncharacterized protein n=1 Tax=Cannabis sativa TaxID=3483 RepID=A0A7J6EPA2_CANSA|nr:hypothetical protein F8388_020563 [Cannabis sativa]